MTRYFRDETGMYIDWEQLERLPDIDTLIDIGVGPMGTPRLYSRFDDAKLLLIDPLDETKEYIDGNLLDRKVMWHQCGVGKEDDHAVINVEQSIGRSTILNVADINYEGEPVDKRNITIKTLDSVTASEKNLGRLGIKIDTEGYELNIIRGATETLKSTEFVLAEVRHNHESFEGVYKLHEFMSAMHDNGFVLSMIITAKPFIADLCFQKRSNLEFIT
jgi:FkbM family methyltransferase